MSVSRRVCASVTELWVAPKRRPNAIAGILSSRLRSLVFDRICRWTRPRANPRRRDER